MQMSYWSVRNHDLQRHLADLRADSYDGVKPPGARQQFFQAAFDLVTPTAMDVLADLNRTVLGGRAVTRAHPVQSHTDLGHAGWWECSWPEQLATRNRFTGTPMPSLRMHVVFPDGFTHGHFAVVRGEPLAPVTSWPLQVGDDEDAQRQRSVLESICETELHEMIFLSSWRILAAS
jgi:hypothetical protein